MTEAAGAAWVSGRLDRLRAGDSAARDDLVAVAAGRLEHLSRAMLRGSFERVGRWVDTVDVNQGVILRLWQALADVVPETPLHFHRLAARLVRLELIDLARHYYGPDGLGANHESLGNAPLPHPITPPADLGRRLEEADVHALVQRLPENEAAVVDLMFYQGLTQDQAAEVLGVDVRTIQRRWLRARRHLGELTIGGTAD